ncbi:cyclic nucleotide-gated olfactory channel [Trichonephila clavipes]|nr:cyclic nucleotide-gated olfactory channel [Trichonephila clavipes]
MKVEGVCTVYEAAFKEWLNEEAFPELQEGWSTMWYCLDSFTDIVFALDIAFQFRTGYLEQGLMVCESKKLACHYIKSKSFILDIAAIIPVDLIQLHFGAIPILRFPRQRVGAVYLSTKTSGAMQRQKKLKQEPLPAPEHELLFR